MSLEEKIQLTIDNLEKAYSIGGLKESPDSKQEWIKNLKILPNQIKFRNKLLGLLKLSKKTDGKENISRFIEDKEEDKENASSFHLNEKQIVFIQSYLATKWSIYEKILEQIFQMFGEKVDDKKPKCATEDLLESTLHPNLHRVFKDEYKKYRFMTSKRH